MSAGQAVTITRSLPRGHGAAVHTMAVKLGLPRLFGSACPERALGGMGYAHAAQRGEAQESVHDGGFMYALTSWRNAA